MATAFNDAIIWTDVPAEFAIKDGVATCRIQSGQFTLELRSTVAVMQAGLLAAEGALAEWRVNELAKQPVVRLLR